MLCVEVVTGQSWLHVRFIGVTRQVVLAIRLGKASFFLASLLCEP